MSDSEKRAACVQKRKAEKKDPKIGTGNKPTMTSYKPKNEGLKEIIKSKLNEFLTEQQTPNLQQRYGFDTQTAPSDYLGRQGDVGKRYAELEKMDLLKKQSEEKIQKLRQEFSCLPSLNQQNKPIDPKLRDSLLLTLKWIKDNEDRATQIFGISKDTLYYLFKLAMTAAHTHSDWGTAPDETRNRKIASLVDTVLGEIGDWIFKGVKGKSPSTGLYQMQAPVYRSMKGTHQLTGKKNIENIWESQITSTLAAMEYFLTLYRQAQSSAKSGPSVTRDGKALVQSTGDHAWDIAITGYQWPVEDLIKKYCKTKNQDGSYNTDYLGPCDKKQVQPFRTEDEAKRAGKKYAGILNVQQNEPVQNFLPEKFVSGTQYSTYDLLNTTKRLIKQMSCF
jgi:hypothetical protein